jgi:hypothetical protein
MRLTCGKCDNGWIREEHPDLPWPHDDAAGPVCRARTRMRFQHHRTWSGLPELSPRTRRDQNADAPCDRVCVPSVWLPLARRTGRVAGDI